MPECRPIRLMLQTAAGLLLASLISGCAGTAKGIGSSVYAQRAPATTFSQAVPSASALVVIRYPAMIHAEAESFYISSFAINAIGGEVPYSVYGKTQTARIAQSVIAKSSYFAMSLYDELKKRLPAESVLLSPHIIVWDEQRGLYSRPILAAEQVPAALTLDFNIYSFPDATEMMDSPPVTFGDLVTPLMVVKSSRWISPAINGLLISSEPLVNAAWRQAELQANARMDARLAGRATYEAAPLDYIAFLAERSVGHTELPVRRTGEGQADSTAIEAYPLEKIQMDASLLANLEENFDIDPFVQGFVGDAALRLVRLLNSMDLQRATFLDRQIALSRFDPELANVYFLQSNDESVRARLQLAEALVDAERAFLSAQSDSVFEGTYGGSYGAKMRKIIEAEYRMLQDRRRLARVQNMTTAVAALALAGSVYGATVTTTASAATVAAFTGVSLVGSIWAANKALDARTESSEVNEYFIARMAPAFERQMSVQMEWLESKEQITARGFAEFRNKTLSLYQARVRSLAVQADSLCVFRHPGMAADGRWYGQCADGQATGRGYGVLRTSGGDSVEFIGEAREGFAWGSGAMIVGQRNRLGQTYYEGSFAAGRPDGVVLIEEPGKAPRLRQFDRGRDIGRGDARQLVKPGFSGSHVSAGTLQP